MTLRRIARPFAAPLASLLLPALIAVVALAPLGCGNGSNAQEGRTPAGHGTGQGMQRPAAAEPAAVPVRVQPVEQRGISRFLETNGVLEAENEVDLVARVAGPVVELAAEEGMPVVKGQLLARIDDREVKNQVAMARVSRDEAKLAFERAQTSLAEHLIAQEAYDAAAATLDNAEVQLKNTQLQLDYTRIAAPFDGVVVTRYVKLAQHVANGAALFRISDFTPLLCPIQVPEKELANVRLGQRARLELDAFPGQSFDARVLRISPTVDAATGTLKVTLEADARGVLRPGLFASVYLETARHDGALVIPRAALVMDSIGDTVFVRDGGQAARREVKLGFRESDVVEVLAGLKAGEEVVVLGQDGLSDGTPVSVLGEEATAAPAAAGEAGAAAPGPPGAEGGEQRGMAPSTGARTDGRPRWNGQAGMRAGGAGAQLAERLRNASPEELERFKQRMRERGMSEEQIEARLAAIRGASAGPTPEPR